MKNFLAILFHIIFLNFCNGQGTYGIKMYVNADRFEYFSTNFDSLIILGESKWTFSRLSFGFNFKNNRRMIHQFEVMIPVFNRSTDKYAFPQSQNFKKEENKISKINYFALRYELFWLRKDRKEKFNYDFGIGFQPLYTAYYFEPKYKTTYLSYFEKQYQASILFSGRLYYQFTNHFLIELSLPIRVFDLGYEMYYTNNPALTKSQKEIKIINFGFLGNTNIRLGIEYKFNKKS
ncbi:MAG: hypothetical protein ABI851_13030 [Saprospiraceae bacterium]